MRRGYIVTVDAMISLMFVVFLILGFFGLQYSNYTSRSASTFESLHYIAENALDTTNKQGVLEEIAYYWSIGNESEARNITKAHLDELLPKHTGYRLEAVDESGVHTIYQSGPDRPTPESAGDLTRSTRILSGYSQDAPRTGWNAKAYLLETNEWGGILVYNQSGCATGWQSIILQNDPTGPYGNVFYVKVPGEAVLELAQINVSFRQSGSTTTTTSTSTTSPTTTTSTTLMPTHCHDCPVISPTCEVLESGPYFSGENKWATDGVDPTGYNYHRFVVPAGGCDNVRIRMHSHVSAWFTQVNRYDIYVNWAGNQCQRPATNPYLASWDCTTYYDFGDFDLTKTCQVAHLNPGTYTFMVDCWRTPGGETLCGGDYWVYIRSSTPACDIGPDPP